MNRHLKHTGFSTVEIIVALFVAAAFIGIGYQLYALIVRDGANARQHAMASDVAYQVLRQQSSGAPDTCTKPKNTNVSATNPGLPTPFTVTVATSCPYPTSGSKGGAITAYTVTVTYGQKEAIHAIYASGASSN